jgi:hypothetical protein
VFADPIADIAVLGAPEEGGERPYEMLVGSMLPLRMGRLLSRKATVEHETPVQMMGLNGKLVTGLAQWRGLAPLFVKATGIEFGMSGSPIMAGGVAIGVLAGEGVCPRLDANLPGWLTTLIKGPPIGAGLSRA